jgi:hypothetical protein
MFTVTQYHTTPRFKPCIVMSQRAMPPQRVAKDQLGCAVDSG